MGWRTPLEGKAVQESQFSREPGQLVDEDKAPDEQKQSAAEKFDGMEIFSKVLVENHELADAEGREQEGNSQAGGVDGEEQDAARNRVAGGGERENGGENWADAGRPAEGEREAQEEAAPDARLGGAAAKVNVAIQPAGHRRAKKADEGKREKMRSA